MKRHTLKWIHSTRSAYLDDKHLSPEKSQKIYNHSPDGFNTGYGGSGPAQLALAILLEIMDEASAKAKYQQFKWTNVAGWPQKDFEKTFKI